MKPSMITRAHDFKVFYAVVEWIAIYMMDVLRGAKLTPNVFF